MLRPNAQASEIARDHGATACTDVSGFGLAGHLGEMLRRSSVSARVSLASLPSLPGVDALLAHGHRSTFHPENARARKTLRVDAELVSDPRLDLVFDPQTSGGLLFGVPADRASRALETLHEAGDRGAEAIGCVAPAREDRALFEVVPGRFSASML